MKYFHSTWLKLEFEALKIQFVTCSLRIKEETWDEIPYRFYNSAEFHIVNLFISLCSLFLTKCISLTNPSKFLTLESEFTVQNKVKNEMSSLEMIRYVYVHT